MQPLTHRIKRTLWQLTQFNLVVLVSVASLWVLHSLSQALLPEAVLLMLVLTLAALLLPLVHGLEAMLHRMLNALPPWGQRLTPWLPMMSVVLMYALLGSLLGILLQAVLPLLITQLAAFGTDWPATIAHLQQRLQVIFPQGTSAFAQPLKQSLLSLATPFRALLFDHVLAVGASTLQWLIYGLTGLVLLFYTLLDGRSWAKTLAHLSAQVAGQGKHSPWQQRVSDMLRQWWWLTQLGIRQQTFIALCSGLVMFGLFSLLGLPYTVLLAVLLGLLTLIPQMGSWLGSLPAWVLLLLRGEVAPLFILLAGLLAWSWVKRQWLLPYALPKYHEQWVAVHHRVHPAWWLLLLLVLLLDLGVWGALFYHPLVAALLVLQASKGNPLPFVGDPAQEAKA
jgi:predicted PurR-regulated permease PerM